jgi:hypothetical protein
METMSDSNEERLLTDLLREVAEADASLTAAPDLEARVLSSWERSRELTRTAQSAKVKVILAIAAVILLVIAGSMRFRSTVPTAEPRRVDVIATPSLNATVEAVEPAQAVSPAKTVRRRPAPMRRQTVDFVPLLPMAPDELSGSFQIVRVQMPRAALGALAGTVDLRRAQDPVQADVLLGEDGMARAIRVSTDGTAPWRVR